MSAQDGSFSDGSTFLTGSARRSVAPLLKQQQVLRQNLRQTENPQKIQKIQQQIRALEQQIATQGRKVNQQIIASAKAEGEFARKSAAKTLESERVQRQTRQALIEREIAAGTAQFDPRTGGVIFKRKLQDNVTVGDSSAVRTIKRIRDQAIATGRDTAIIATDLPAAEPRRRTVGLTPVNPAVQSFVSPTGIRAAQNFFRAVGLNQQKKRTEQELDLTTIGLTQEQIRQRGAGSFDVEQGRVDVTEENGELVVAFTPRGPTAEEVLTSLQQNFFEDRKSTRLNSSHSQQSRMPSSA